MKATASPNKRVSTRATGIVGLAILCSRVLGLIREVIFASLFGASRNMDAFLTAFRAPNMLRDLFAEGALSTAFVTTFSRRIATEGDLAIGVALGISGDDFAPAVDGSIVNRGVIATKGNGAAGVVMVGEGHHLTNSGQITTDGGAFDGDIIGLLRAAGVVVSGDGALVENTRSGVIESNNARSAAVELNVVERDGVTIADMSSTLDNDGLIKGAAVAVLGGAGQETVINHGHIIGDVVLGEGADTFVFGKGGSLAGDLYLGAGNDLVRFEKGAGIEHIADFAAGTAGGDVINVSAFFSNFDALKAHSTQHGNDVIIDFGHGDQLVLEHVTLNALNAGDFILA